MAPSRGPGRHHWLFETEWYQIFYPAAVYSAHELSYRLGEVYRHEIK
jgi:hypothetical protein